MLEWIRLEANVTVAGKSLGELRIREKTGVSIVAILRGENLLPSPKENKILLGRDYLLIIGKKDEIEKFKEMIGEGKEGRAVVASVTPFNPPLLKGGQRGIKKSVGQASRLSLYFSGGLNERDCGCLCKGDTGFKRESND